jgi:hypothetical protein
VGGLRGGLRKFGLEKKSGEACAPESNLLMYFIKLRPWVLNCKTTINLLLFCLAVLVYS